MGKRSLFVGSDIHGFFSEWMEALKEKGFERNNPDHIVVICGDLLDRGKEARETVDFAYDLLQEKRLIFIKGNHEDLYEMMVERGYAHSNDISNGTLGSAIQLSDDASNWYKWPKKWKALINSTINYYEVGNIILTHGFIPIKEVVENCEIKNIYDPKWREANQSRWDIARWYNGQELVCKHAIKEPGKTIIVGHWNCSWGNVRKLFPDEEENWREFEWDKSKPELFEPFITDGLIAIDAATPLTHKINILVLEENDEEENQSN